MRIRRSLLMFFICACIVCLFGRLDVNSAPTEVEINYNLVFEDGSVKEINADNTIFHDGQDIVAFPKNDFSYTVTYDNGFSFTRDCVAGTNPNFISLIENADASAGKNRGSTSCKVTLTGFEGTFYVCSRANSTPGLINTVINGIDKPNYYDYESFDTATLSGSIDCKLVYQHPNVANGDISFGSYDGLLDDEPYSYQFWFGLNEDVGGSYCVDQMYWTLDDDSTKHYADMVDDQDNIDEYYFYVNIPAGSTAHFHNFPLKALFHEGTGIPPFDADDKVIYSSHEFGQFLISKLGSNCAQTALIYNGQNVFDSTYGGSLTGIRTTDLGIIDRIYYSVDHGDGKLTSGLDTSGSFINQGFQDGFKINLYVIPSSAQLVFGKAESGVDINQTNLDNRFRITLTDERTGTPRSEKVGYYLVDKNTNTIDYSDVRYAIPDGNGVIEINVPYGTYIILGRMNYDEADEIRALELYNGATSSYSSGGYFPSNISIAELGFLPVGTKYVITEVTDDYTCTLVHGTDTGVLTVDDHLDVTKMTTRSEMLTYIGDNYTLFENARKLATLKISKVVKGLGDGSSYEFTLKLTDDILNFPKVLSFSNSNGTSGNLTLTQVTAGTYSVKFSLKAGEIITITGIPSGTGYEITEADGTGYTTSYTDCTGVVRATTAASVTNTYPTPTATPSVTPTVTPTSTPMPTGTVTPTPKGGDSPIPQTGENTSVTTVVAIAFFAMSAALLVGSRIVSKKED